MILRKLVVTQKNVIIVIKNTINEVDDDDRRHVHALDRDHDRTIKKIIDMVEEVAAVAIAEPVVTNLAVVEMRSPPNERTWNDMMFEM